MPRNIEDPSAGSPLTKPRPDYVTESDSYGGEGRNHDLVVIGTAAGGPTLVSIEAKSTEHLGDPVQWTLDKARARSVKTKVADRIDLLANAVLGHSAVADRTTVSLEIAESGYQLLTSARRCRRGRAPHCKQAVLLIQCFVEPHPTKQEEDEYVHVLSDLAAFRHLLDGPDQRTLTPPPKCVGPFQLRPGGRIPAGIDFLVAHAVAELPPKEISGYHAR